MRAGLPAGSSVVHRLQMQRGDSRMGHPHTVLTLCVRKSPADEFPYPLYGVFASRNPPLADMHPKAPTFHHAYPETSLEGCIWVSGESKAGPPEA